MNPHRRHPLITVATVLVYFFLYAPIFVLMLYSFNASRTNIKFTGFITQFGETKMENGNVISSPCGPFHWYCDLAKNNEVIGAAFLYPNIYLVPDMYIFQPGSKLYVEAANSFLSEQLLFGSSYPFRAMKQSVDDFAALGFNDNILDKVFYENAKRILSLTA